MFTLAFWRATLERAIRTAAQSVLLVIGLNEGGALDIRGLDFAGLASTAAGGFALAVLTCLVASQVGERTSPSFSRAEVLNPVPPGEPMPVRDDAGSARLLVPTWLLVGAAILASVYALL